MRRGARSCSLAMAAFLLAASTAHARGLYLQVFERDAQGKLRLKHMLEKIPRARCSTTIQRQIHRSGETLASCRTAGSGYLAAWVDRSGARLKVVRYDARPRPTWERAIDGTLAYSGDFAFSRADVLAGAGRRRGRRDDALRLRARSTHRPLRLRSDRAVATIAERAAGSRLPRAR